MRFLSIYLRELVCTHIRPCRDYETPAPGAAGRTPSRLKNGSGKYMTKFSIFILYYNSAIVRVPVVPVQRQLVCKVCVFLVVLVLDYKVLLVCLHTS